MRSFLGFLAFFIFLVGSLAGLVGLLVATVATQVYVGSFEPIGISRLGLGLASAASLIGSLLVAAWRSNNWPEGQTIASRDAQSAWAFICLVACGAVAASGIVDPSLASEWIAWSLGGFAALLVLVMARSKGNSLVRVNELRLMDTPVRYSQRWVAWINWAFRWVGDLKPEPFMPVAVIMLILASSGTLLALIVGLIVEMSFIETALAALVSSLLAFAWCLIIQSRANFWDARDYRAFTEEREKEGSPRLVRVGRGVAEGYGGDELMEPDMASRGGLREARH